MINSVSKIKAGAMVWDRIVVMRHKSWRLKLPGTRLFVQVVKLSDNKENIKAPHYYTSVQGIHRESTGQVDSPHNGLVMRKAFLC